MLILFDQRRRYVRHVYNYGYEVFDAVVVQSFVLVLFHKSVYLRGHKFVPVGDNRLLRNDQGKSQNDLSRDCKRYIFH